MLIGHESVVMNSRFSHRDFAAAKAAALALLMAVSSASASVSEPLGSAEREQATIDLRVLIETARTARKLSRRRSPDGLGAPVMPRKRAFEDLLESLDIAAKHIFEEIPDFLRHRRLFRRPKENRPAGPAEKTRRELAPHPVAARDLGRHAGQRGRARSEQRARADSVVDRAAQTGCPGFRGGIVVIITDGPSRIGPRPRLAPLRGDREVALRRVAERVA